MNYPRSSATLHACHIECARVASTWIRSILASCALAPQVCQVGKEGASGQNMNLDEPMHVAMLFV